MKQFPSKNYFEFEIFNIQKILCHAGKNYVMNIDLYLAKTQFVYYHRNCKQQKKCIKGDLILDLYSVYFTEYNWKKQRDAEKLLTLQSSRCTYWRREVFSNLKCSELKFLLGTFNVILFYDYVYTFTILKNFVKTILWKANIPAFITYYRFRFLIYLRFSNREVRTLE